MPSRVLYVGSNQGYCVFLVEPRSSEILLCTPAPYAALSYCWGSDQMVTLTTTKSTYEEHRRGIGLDLLPKTLKDAVIVCRGLKIEYLWIDALCIVQDDADDWRYESAQMQEVYGNSYITIAAHQAESCVDGFLGQQSFGQPAWQRPFYVLIGTGESIKMHLPTGSESWKWREGSPLMRRGWTLQEALLPRRILYYTGHELVWECDTKILCECGHISDPVYLRHRDPVLKTYTEISCNIECAARQ
ncbi:heterokaryon incompatibility protein-domain-containing protein [Podospora fimiseda]|uniref:Heterokaryon incompatibility protein-domain-containing protein n=1 Tax=Podospora fimiseda TaxID=252190 RepID=A0AAN7BXP5_9PEZI|nr:heterokaryon incompatibility protein-domain-containing protein [Podospora fimiseda]